MLQSEKFELPIEKISGTNNLITSAISNKFRIKFCDWLQTLKIIILTSSTMSAKFSLPIIAPIDSEKLWRRLKVLPIPRMPLSPTGSTLLRMFRLQGANVLVLEMCATRLPQRYSASFFVTWLTSVKHLPFVLVAAHQ